MNKNNISRDEIAEAMKIEFGFNRKLCLDIVNDIVDIIIEGLRSDKKVKIHNFGTFKMNNKKRWIKCTKNIMFNQKQCKQIKNKPQN